MSYTRTTWIARVGTALNRFLKTNEDSPSGTVELTNDPTGVTTAGTPFTVANMNKIEDGIYDAHVLIDNHIADVANPHAVSKEQVAGLKETDNPIFSGINLNGLLLFSGPSTTILSNFASPSTGLYGLAFDGTNLISCDEATDLIYIHDGISATILSSFSAVSRRGLAFDGTNLISATTNTIYIHDGISATILSSFSAPSSNIVSISFDGNNLISCDFSTKLIYIHSGITSTILSSFASPGGPTGLAIYGTNLISATYDTIYIHDGISATILSSFASPASNTSQLTYADNKLISGNSATDIIYIHKPILLQKVL